MISEKLKIAIDMAKALDERTNKLQKEINKIRRMYECKPQITQYTRYNKK